MTKQEAGARYGIPVEILDEYESWGLCDEVKQVMGAWQYDDRDLEQLSMIMALHDVGFDREEVHRYMQLLRAEEPTEEKRLEMLNQKRSSALEEIHLKEAQLSRLDYLRHCIRNGKKP